MTVTTRVLISVVTILFVSVLGLILKPRPKQSECTLILQKLLIRWNVAITANRYDLNPTKIEADLESFVQQRVKATGALATDKPETKSKLLFESPREPMAQLKPKLEPNLIRDVNWTQLDQETINQINFMAFTLTKSPNKLNMDLSKAEQSCLDKIPFAIQIAKTIPR